MTTEPKSAPPAAAGGKEGGKEDWGKPRPDVIPRPTYVPAAMAFALTLTFWGLVTSPVVLAMGLVLFALSLAGWIAEMRA